MRTKVVTKKKVIAGRSSDPSTAEITAPISNPLVFISHDSRDAELAEAFSKLLSSVSAGMLKSFRSSDRKGTEGIEYGVEWYPEVMGKIELACDVVCLLTPRSLERPWILYEAGVAKGKLNTPVHGVALGVPLAKASTGPFAQFQNCDDDEKSLQKLIMQLMKRVAGAEPDHDTVAMQIVAFKARTKTVLEEIAKLTSPGTKPSENAEESSVAKLFEEVKVMFRDLPSRIDSRVARSTKTRLRHYPPELISDMLGPGSEGVELLILVSFVKDQAPWIYELGIGVYRAIRDGNDDLARTALRELISTTELTMHHPMLRETSGDRETLYIVMRELARFSDRFFPLKKIKQTSREQKEK